MPAPIHTIVETAAFTGQLNKLRVSADERNEIYDTYAADPKYGTVVKHTGGLRKGRVGKDDTGKSGGYRVLSFFANDRHPTFLLWIIDKTKDANLTAEQAVAFKAATTILKKECK